MADIYGTPNDDVLNGTSGSDYIYGFEGNDTLLGGAGNDQLYGGSGDDVYNGGTGNDVMQDFSGNDTYVWGVGSGQDTVLDSGAFGEIDTVQVTSGITPTNLLITQDPASNFGALTLRLAQSDDQLVIQNYNSIEQIQFADGTIWDAAAIQAHTLQGQTGTAGNDYLSGYATNNYLQGLGGNDTLYGNVGTDALMGGAGNDQLYGGSGDDVYNGGTGNDVMQDFAGSDTYIFGVGSGQDTVLDSGAFGEIDTVQVTSGVTPTNLLITQDWATNPGGLTLRLAQSDDQLIIQGFNTIEQIQFANGTLWDAAAIQARVQQVQTGTAGNEYLSGYATNNYLQGLGGDDTLYGNYGIDALMGGAGNDQLYGGSGDDVYNGGTGNDVMQDFSGNDTYVWGVGSGQDTVSDWGAFGEIDTVQLTSGVTPTNLFITQDGASSSGLTLRLAQSDDQLILSNFNSIEQIQFADGTLWDAAAIQARLQQSQTGTEGNDYLWGSAEANYLQGLGGDDNLYGNEGDDVLIGGAGDDFLDGGLGNDVYDGGAGTDYMNDFQGGSDTYRWGTGSGQDTVADFDFTPGNIDTVEVASGVAPSDVTITRDLGVNATAITLRLNATGDALTLQNWFDPNGQIEQIHFADGTVWDAPAVLARLQSSLTGTEGNDNLFGSELADTISGLGGNDSLQGQAGNDTLLGGAGDDFLDGGLGNDVLDGGTGADTMYGEVGDDTYLVDNASDLVYEFTGGGNDTVLASVNVALFNDAEVERVVLTGSNSITATGSFTDNTLIGNSGDNVLDGSLGGDTMQGGIGNDTYVVDSVGDVVTENLNEGIDSVQSSVTYTLGANVENLALTGSLVINGTGNSLDNVITGNSAANVLDGGAGIDTMAGGLGDDIYVVDNAFDVVTELGGEGIDTIQRSFEGGNILAANVENLTLTGSTAIMASGNTLDNIIRGNSTGNVIDGLAGADTMIGGDGNDAYIVDNVGDVVVENAGEGIRDIVQSSISYTLAANVEELWLAGTAAINATGNSQDNTLMGNSAANMLDGGAGADAMWGGAGDDTYIVDNINDATIENVIEGIDSVQSSVSYTLGANVENLTLTGAAATNATGNALNNVLTGNSAVNVLDGGAGVDVMFGGAGDDTYIIDSFGETVIEAANEGTDTVQSSVGYSLSANVENLVLTGTNSIAGIGNGSNNTLTGNSAANVLDGGLGVDTMVGGAGDDTYVVDNIGDVVTEAANEGTDVVHAAISYTLGGNVENLVLDGSAAINGTGNSLNNTVVGNSAANLLDGGAGSDTMIGGQGNDTYLVDNVGDVTNENLNEGTDTIQSSVTYTLGVNVENLTLTSASVINGTGNALDNVLTGNSAANVLSGGAGNDTYVVAAGDTVVENTNEGLDTVQSAVTVTLGANVENLTLTGVAAINGTGNSLVNVIAGNSAANVIDGGTGADTMAGGLGNDTYVVDNAGDIVTEGLNEGTDTVQSSVTYTLGANVENLTLTGSSAINGTGNSLDNVLTGNSAANVLTGGGGNDTYVIGAGDSVVEAANSGTDTVQSALTYTLGSNLENLTLTGSAAINGTGNSLDNVLTGNSAANVMTGGAGNDTYVVGSGDSVVEAASAGTDTVQSSVAWTLGSNLENLTLIGLSAINGTGNSSANILIGNSANNNLSGANGSDTLRGGLGNDTVNGGSGNDTFLFGRGDGQDLVQDNSGTADKLLYDAGINPLDLVISRQANDLRLSIHGSTDSVTVQNWYTSSVNRTETIQAGNGQTLLSTQVDQLIQAMAGFTQQTGLTWDQAIDQRPQDVQTVLAASWQ